MAAVGLWLVSGLAAWLPAFSPEGVIVIVAILAISRDLHFLQVPFPQNARQVPRSVLDRAPWWAALQFGFELGSGVRTYVTTAAPYVLATALFLVVPSLSTALAIGSGFGFGRFMMALSRYTSSDGDVWDMELRRRRAVLTGASVVSVILATGLAIWT